MTVTPLTTGADTVTVADDLAPPSRAVAVMEALPRLSPTTVPDAETDATAGLEELHVTRRSKASTGETPATSCRDPLIGIVVELGRTVTLATGTVTVIRALDRRRPSRDVAVMVVAPTARPWTVPSARTLATLEFIERQRMPGSDALVGVTTVVRRNSPPRGTRAVVGVTVMRIAVA